MGIPVELKDSLLTFVVKEIKCIDYKGHEVRLGYEDDGCSFFTKAAIIDYPDIKPEELVELRKILQATLAKTET